MNIIFKKRIHIVPVGFEYDRIILPITGNQIDTGKADAVYLITRAGKDDAKLYVREIIKMLKKENISFELIDCDIDDVYEILREMRKIIENEKNNDIYINVSSGSTMCTIAGVMAAMLFKKEDTYIEPYYVKPVRYKKSKDKDKLDLTKDPFTYGIKEIIPIPNYKAHLPDSEKIDVMKIISEKGNEGVRKQQIVKFFYPTPTSTNEKSSNYMKVTRRLIEPLRNTWNLLKVEGNGRNAIIKLTKNGQDMIKFLKDD